MYPANEKTYKIVFGKNQPLGQSELTPTNAPM
jgi:hypothetical protein